MLDDGTTVNERPGKGPCTPPAQISQYGWTFWQATTCLPLYTYSRLRLWRLHHLSALSLLHRGEPEASIGRRVLDCAMAKGRNSRCRLSFRSIWYPIHHAANLAHQLVLDEMIYQYYREVGYNFKLVEISHEPW